MGLPTETVYGLAANALRPESVLGVFRVKGRPSFDPLIVHLAHADKADEVALMGPAARALAALWPGPLTLLVPRRPCVPDEVTAGLPDVALRVPRHPLAL